MGTNGEPEHNLMIEESDAHLMQIDPRRSRFPCCIVWTPLPVLSWFLPCVGHIGICREDGVILDFAGPNFVCVDNFAFGAPTRFFQISKEKCCTIVNSVVHDSNDETDLGRDVVTWDDALRKSTQEYQHHSYNIFTCNCHSFVANGLNRLKFQAGGWNVVNLAVFIFLKGQWDQSIAFLFSFLLAASLMKSWRGKRVEKESVTILPSFGVQLETTYRSGRTVRCFVPIRKILKPVLNECVNPVTCYWSLSLIIREEQELLLVFKEVHPPVTMLVPIWKALCRVC